MAKAKTLVPVKTLYLSININTNSIINKNIVLLSTNSFNLKKHLTYFSCSSDILHIP